jgi:hypothetical protein
LDSTASEYTSSIETGAEEGLETYIDKEKLEGSGLWEKLFIFYDVYKWHEAMSAAGASVKELEYLEWRRYVLEKQLGVAGDNKYDKLYHILHGKPPKKEQDIKQPRETTLQLPASK